jgi:hypothetical protein
MSSVPSLSALRTNPQKKIQRNTPSLFNWMKRAMRRFDKPGSENQIRKRQKFFGWEVPASFSPERGR